MAVKLQYLRKVKERLQLQQQTQQITTLVAV